MNEFIEMYNGNRIVYNLISFHYNLKVIEGSVGESVVIPTSCRSALIIICNQYMDYSESVSGDAWSADTIGTTIKGNVIEWQFQVVSETYPMNKALSYGVFNGDTFNHCQPEFSSHSANYECNSIIPEEHYAFNTVLIQDVGGAANLTNKSTKFIMAISGLDLSSTDIQLHILRSGPVTAGGAQMRPYLRSWIVLNKLIVICRNGAIVYS